MGVRPFQALHQCKESAEKLRLSQLSRTKRRISILCTPREPACQDR